jgi:Putative transmembrane protein (PGPGW)
MFSTISSWFEQPAVMWGVGIFSVLAVVASIVFVPRFLASLPQGYLRGDAPEHKGPAVLRVLKNLLGVLLVLIGVLMLVLPGQGLLTLVVGLFFIDFPGKHRLMRRVLSRPKVLGVVNKLRAKHESPPLVT